MSYLDRVKSGIEAERTLIKKQGVSPWLKNVAVRDTVAPYVFIMPFLLLFFTFFVYATVRALYFSFTDYNLFDAPNFVWFSNYIALFREYLFGIAFKNSLTFSLVVTCTQTVTSLLLAIAMNQKIRGMSFFRGLYYMPSITSSVVITLLFMWMFQRKGVINYLATNFVKQFSSIFIFTVVLVVCQIFLVMQEKAYKRPVTAFEPSFFMISVMVAIVATFIARRFNIISMQESALVDTIWFNTRETIPTWAGTIGAPRPLVAIMMLNIWTTTPTFMLLYLAGLQDIPKTLYEAADVDGANKLEQLWYITIPQLRHVTFLVVTMGLIGTLQMFDQVAIIGNQAPLESTVTLAYYVYTNAFPSSGVSKIGMASAAAIVLALVTLMIVFIQKKFTDDGEGE